MNKKAILIVLDSVGIGEQEDSYLFGDTGSNTLKHIAEAVGGLRLPCLESLGLGNIEDIPGVDKQVKPKASYGKMREKSLGKDTTTGHWEMMGVISQQPFPTYPQGFPSEIIEAFEKAIGRKTIGNIVASGTVIIEQLGKEHMQTGYPIVYTSADSVFQIAAHEEIIPLSELYSMCRKAREILTGEHGVGRVIARPFIGQPGNFTRTANRHDFSLQPPETILDFIVAAGLQVIGVGKINDIFAGKGITETYPTQGNKDGVTKLIKIMQQDFTGLLFANLVDFDQSFGHRNDPKGYARALEEFDNMLPLIISELQSEDMLIITADHGCDPTTVSTDHSREYVPLLVWGPNIKSGINLNTRSTFADLGQTIAEFLNVNAEGLPGQSFYSLLK